MAGGDGVGLGVGWGPFTPLGGTGLPKPHNPTPENRLGLPAPLVGVCVRVRVGVRVRAWVRVRRGLKKRGLGVTGGKGGSG